LRFILYKQRDKKVVTYPLQEESFRVNPSPPSFRKGRGSKKDRRRSPPLKILPAYLRKEKRE
jgi:hypothetical protein